MNDYNECNNYDLEFDTETDACAWDKNDLYKMAMRMYAQLEKSSRPERTTKPKSFKDKENDALVKHLVAM